MGKGLQPGRRIVGDQHIIDRETGPCKNVVVHLADLDPTMERVLECDADALPKLAGADVGRQNTEKHDSGAGAQHGANQSALHFAAPERSNAAYCSGVSTSRRMPGSFTASKCV